MAAEVVAVITITLKKDGTVEFLGPIEQMMLCYGMMEVSKDIIREDKRRRESLVKPPSAEDLEDLKRPMSGPPHFGAFGRR